MSALRVSLQRPSLALFAFPACAVLLAAAVLIGSRAVASAASELPVVAVPGFQVSVFAKGTTTHFGPDAITLAHGNVWVAYQNKTAKDGSDHKSSTVVVYNRQGQIVHTLDIQGHADGLRFDPRMDQVWALVNNDANPKGYLIDPHTFDVEPVTFPPTPHGGGYDDLTFIGGKAYISASNPTLNAKGVNVFPAVDEINLKIDGTAVLTPVLMGNSGAVDGTTNQIVGLNLIDPDSMSTDPAGDVVLLDQAGSEIILLHKPDTSTETTTRIPTGTQLEDTVWAAAGDRVMFIVDGSKNTIYMITSDFKPGTVFTEAPSDSGVAGWVGTLDLKTGIVTPIAIGFGSPTGLIFAASEDFESQN